MSAATGSPTWSSVRGMPKGNTRMKIRSERQSATKLEREFDIPSVGILLECKNPVQNIPLLLVELHGIDARPKKNGFTVDGARKSCTVTLTNLTDRVTLFCNVFVASKTRQPKKVGDSYVPSNPINVLPRWSSYEFQLDLTPYASEEDLAVKVFVAPEMIPFSAQHFKSTAWRSTDRFVLLNVDHTVVDKEFRKLAEDFAVLDAPKLDVKAPASIEVIEEEMEKATVETLAGYKSKAVFDFDLGCNFDLLVR